MLDANDLAKTYYSAARAEIVQRLALREQVLLAGVTAFGVIGGLALSGKVPGLLGLFPLLSFAFTVVLFRHHFLITDLGDYINFELAPSLGLAAAEGAAEGSDNVPMPVHWDAWLLFPKGRHARAPRRKLRAILSVELFGAWLLLWGPGAGGFAFVLIFHKVSRLVVCVDSALLLFAIAPFLLEARRLLFQWGRQRKC